MRGTRVLGLATLLGSFCGGVHHAFGDIVYMEQRAGLFGDALPLASVNMNVNPYSYLYDGPDQFQQDVSEGTRISDLRSNGFSLTCGVFASRTVAPNFTSELFPGLGASSGIFLRFAVGTDTWVRIERTRLDEHTSNLPGDTSPSGGLGTFGFRPLGGPSIPSLEPRVSADPMTVLLQAGQYEVFMGMFVSGVGLYSFDYVHSESYRLNYTYALTIVPSPATAGGLLALVCVSVRRRRSAS